MGQILSAFNQFMAPQQVLLDPTAISLERLLEAIEEINGITNALVDSNGNRLFFTLQDEIDPLSTYWRSLARVHCETVSTTTGVAQKSRVYTLRQFSQFYTFIVEQHTEQLVGGNMRASIIMNALPSEDDNICPICMDRRLEQILPCSHGYCSECINTWNAQSQRCPLCRREISLDDERWELTERPPMVDISNYINATVDDGEDDKSTM